MDLFGRGKIMLNGCELLVIDEADRMLDMGFIPDIEEICSKLPKSRQTLLFSATMPPPIQKLAAKFLNDPKRVEATRPATANVNIEQRLIVLKPDKKKDAVRDILRSAEFKNAIIFCNRKTTVRELATALKRSGFAAGQIQGDMDQSDRIAEFDRFKNNEINVLVASDVAARGLDVKGVTHVINFDVPWQPDDYIHRIGRTGRAGATGIAISLATAADADQVAAIEKLTGTKIARVGAASEAASPPEAAAGSEPREAREPRPTRDSRKPRQAREPRAEREARPERAPRQPRDARSETTQEKPAPAPAKAKEEREPRQPREPRSPVVEDIDGEWNGPLPSFLTRSAG
jgi:superfamily II DNA/RNA helicase